MRPPRYLSIVLVCSFLLLPFPAIALEPTPSTGLGPFFPVDLDTESDPDLTRVAGSKNRPRGQEVLVEGTVRNADGKSLAGAEIVIWQTDQHGKYRHPRENRRSRSGEPIPEDPAFQYWGKTLTDARGAYRFRTILPGAYGGRVRHIHFRIQHQDHSALGTELHFQGDSPGGDFVTTPGEHDRLAAILEPIDGEPGVQRARFDIVLP